MKSQWRAIKSAFSQHGKAGKLPTSPGHADVGDFAQMEGGRSAKKKPGPFLNGGHCVAKASLLMVLMVFGGGFFLFGEFMNGNRMFLSRMMVIWGPEKADDTFIGGFRKGASPVQISRTFEYPKTRGFGFERERYVYMYAYVCMYVM